MSNDPLNMIHESTESTAPRKESWAWVGLVVLIILHVSINFWWLRVDNHAVRSDEEVHMYMARQYFEAMYFDPGASMLDRILEVGRIPLENPAHPPLLHAAGATSIALFGYNADIMAGTNTLFFVLILLGAYRILRTFLSPNEALFGTTIVSLTPLIFSASRFFMTDFLSLAIVVWVIYTLIKSDQFRNTGWVFCFAMLNGLGFLCRATTFLYYLVPCMVVVGLGLFLALKSSAGPVRRAALGRWLLHCTMTFVVTVGIFSPWYFHHADAFIKSWTVDHQSQNPFAQLVPETWDESDPWLTWPRLTEVAHAAPEDGGSAAPSGSKLGKLFGRVLSPSVDWREYPIHAINNGTFLVLFILGIAGIPLALRMRRFYSMSTIILLLWLLGAWFFMTILFKSSAARYTLQALPPIAMFATVAILAIPRLRVRQIAGGVLLVVLGFQFFNLSVHAAGPIKRVELPIVLHQDINDHYTDSGLVVFKHTLGVGDAYSHMEAPTQENFRDWIFATMMEGEAALGAQARGEYANYLRLGARGLTFHEQHYWPEPNPYKHPGVPSDALPKRKFRDIGFTWSVDELGTKLSGSDYVVMAVPTAQPHREKHWRDFLAANGFQQIGDTYLTQAGGMKPARHFAVYQRTVATDEVRIETVEDIQALGLNDLYYLKSHPDYARLDHRLRQAAEAQFKSLVETGQPPYPMSDAVDFINANLNKVGEGLFEFQLIFKTKKKMNEDLRMFFHGYPSDPTALPQKYQAQKYQDWNFDPAPPTSAWPANDYVILTHRIDAKAAPWRFNFGLFRGGNDLEGRPVQMNMLDLSQL